MEIIKILVFILLVVTMIATPFVIDYYMNKKDK